ncbi:MAG: NUDIX domain-containing protein [Ardenticatenaceae bacterium]|nr:NUDIX domain-containing protein [Ardenticatenaceae bacterium]MCB9443574.1 NUDIX domain-containing protein [Ardenticatenaceae bacterium]
MKIGTNGIVTNESGQVLLIQRDDSRTFAPPGGSVETGELPTDNIAREVREETGLIVLPVRLVGVYFWPMKPEGLLSFVFRCIQRGGEIATSDESLQVDYFWPRALPKPMINLHRERLEHGLNHQGGPVHWATHRIPLKLRLMSLWLGLVVYPRMNRQRKRDGKPDYVPAPQWQITAVTIIRNQDNHILWLKDGDHYHLPGGGSTPMEAPWETAVRHARQQTQQTIQLTNLTTITVHPQKPIITMAFTAKMSGTAVSNANWFAPGSEPENSLPEHRQLVAEANGGGETAVFRHQTM